jgi:Ca2+-binding RTX toxin-like protein
MAVMIKVDGGVFDRETLDRCLKSLALRDFVENDGQHLVYGSGKYQITMSGEIAAAAGEQPRGWDLNNSQINDMTFTHGSQKLVISGLAMDLREIYQSRSLDDLRDWNDFSRRQDYHITGSGQADLIRASTDGSSVIEGRAGDDRLVSLGTNDRLFGGAGNDTIVARGANTALWGEAGSDKFVIRHADSEPRIMDFEAGRDHLAFGAALDKLIRGNQDIGDRLKFIGDDDFGSGRYEIRADVRHSEGDTFTIIELSLRGHEYQVAELKGAVDLGWCDFIL